MVLYGFVVTWGIQARFGSSGDDNRIIAPSAEEFLNIFTYNLNIVGAGDLK